MTKNLVGMVIAVLGGVVGGKKGMKKAKQASVRPVCELLEDRTVPAQLPSISVLQKPIESMELVGGEKAVPMGEFTVKVTSPAPLNVRANYALLEGMNFLNIGDDLDDVDRCYLRMDGNGDGRYEQSIGTATPVIGVVSFGSKWKMLFDSERRILRFQLTCDIGAAPEAENVGVKPVIFASNIQRKSIPQEYITYSGTPVIHHVEQETNEVHVRQSTVAVRPLQVLAGNLSETVASYTITPNGSGYLNYLQFQVTEQENVDRLEIWLPGETSPRWSATSGGCDNYEDGMFCTFRGYPLQLQEGQDQDVLVRARMKSDEQGGENGFLQITLSAVEVLDQSNDMMDVTYEGNLVGTRHEVVLSKIASVNNANPDADYTAVPTGFFPFFQIKVDAAWNTNSHDALNKVDLETGVIWVTAENVMMHASSFVFYNKADSTTRVECVAVDDNGNTLTGYVTGRFRVICSDLAAHPIDTSIFPGTDETFVLAGEIVNAKVDSSKTSILQGAMDLAALVWHDRDASRDVLIHGSDLADLLLRSTKYVG